MDTDIKPLCLFLPSPRAIMELMLDLNGNSVNEKYFLDGTVDLFDEAV